MSWIELNLPYDYRGPRQPLPKYPDNSEKGKEKFGKTIQEFGEEFIIYHDEFMKIKNDFKRDLNSSNLKLTFEEETNEINSFLEEIRKTNSKVDLALSNLQIRKEYRDWEDTLPEVQDSYKKMKENDKEYKLKMAPLSFNGMGLNKPGVLIQYEQNDVLKTELIGSINLACGVCGDCSAFQDDTVILRYKVVFDLEAI